MALKTDYKDDIIKDGGARKYKQTTNSDGTISLTDKTVYSQEGSTFAAKDINETNAAVNRLNHVTTVTLTASGWNQIEASGIYSQQLSLDGVTAEDEPLLVSALEDGADTSTQLAYSKAFGIVASGTAVTGDGYVSFKTYKKPATDVTVGLKGV
ncbi:hypothetical protein DWZ16_10950 [Clostridium sp. AF29-8BH]|jgi:hypothetical protein|uniref:hypothetical protein n=1 Tax=Clostridium sp. AF29-8BH TaxID=2293009 RepID=UPI000E4CC1C9|nr:hypothetical protein DWZ16_10950 [Clostridium sp. AF29-8BH]